MPLLGYLLKLWPCNLTVAGPVLLHPHPMEQPFFPRRSTDRMPDSVTYNPPDI